MVGRLSNFITACRKLFGGSGRPEDNRSRSEQPMLPQRSPAVPTPRPTTATPATPNTSPSASPMGSPPPPPNRRRRRAAERKPTVLRSARQGKHVRRKNAKPVEERAAVKPVEVDDALAEAESHELSERTQPHGSGRSTRLKRRRAKRKPRTTLVKLNSDELPLTPMAAAWCERTLHVGVRALREEFMRMRTYEPPRCTTKAFYEQRHRVLNRYKDVRLLDGTRVRLQTPREYIHASYVSDTKGERRFILTQGPLDVTIGDFWNMVWQEGSDTIVMVCDFVETEKRKCADYVPTRRGETMCSERIEVRNMRVADVTVEGAAGSFRRAELQLTCGDERRLVTHVLWTGWPDRAVPPSTAQVLFLCEAVLAKRHLPVVHCSAGIGRTGTLVAVALAVEMLRDDERLDCAVLFKHLRSQRMQSIQTDVQYLFLHRCLLDYLVQHHALKAESTKLTRFTGDYDPVVAAALPARPL